MLSDFMQALEEMLKENTVLRAENARLKLALRGTVPDPALPVEPPADPPPGEDELPSSSHLTPGVPP